MTRIPLLCAFLIPLFCSAQQNTTTAPASTSQSKKTPKQPAPDGSPNELAKRRIAPDDTGYIEGAFIQSQFRFRFDAGFGDRNIDLASYFYSAGLKNQISKLNFQEYHFRLEYAFAKRFSAFVDTPIRTFSPKVSFECVPECGQSQTQTLAPASNEGFTGLSDLHAGLKFGLLDNPEQHLTFQLSTSFPSGDTSHGLGMGHYTFEPSVLYARKLNERAHLFGEFGDSHPIGGARSFVFDPSMGANKQKFAGDVINYGVGASFEMMQGSKVRITPVLELVGWKVAGGLETIIAPGPTGQPIAYVVPPGTAPSFGSNIVNLKGGWRTSWGQHNSVYAGLGVQLSHAGWYRELLRMEYRYTFDKLF